MKNILILDVAQQGNSGDDIMQQTLVDLTKKYGCVEPKLMTYFGSNEFEIAKSEFTFYEHELDVSVIHGVASTHVLSSQTSVFLLFKRLLSVLNVFLFCLLVKVGLGKVYSKIFMNDMQRHAINEILNAHLIIWNGRNFRGSDRGGMRETLKVAELCLNPLVCMVLNKKMVNLGSSVWKLKSFFSKWILSKLIHSCETFYVRENTSLEYLVREFPSHIAGKVKYMPDLSLYTLSKSRPKFVITDKDSKTVGLTLVGCLEIGDKDKFQYYLNTLSKVVSYLGKLNYKIVVVPQVTYSREPYSDALNFLQINNPEVDIKELETDGKIETLLACYSNLDFLIASRMHSAIFALSVDTPVYAIAYDVGAKWSILNEIGLMEEHLTSPETLNFSRVIEFIDLNSKLPIDNKNKLEEKSLLIENVFAEELA
ncbi:polysaccharide pyruvyl transferase family protein [Neptuniibacter sp. QD48_11]|uniref:polysaccharide pyruvyl transferase family protein n=1 Tax=Neptuniibacter sp. QD48_11 TaxID=3398211 RepID=UPI0039F492AE